MVTWYYIFVIIDVVFYFLSMMQRNWAYDCKHFLNCCKWLCAEKADLKANLLVCLTTFSRAYDKMWKWSCNQKLAIHKAKWHKRYYSPFHSENLCTSRPWATLPQEALILKIHGSKFCQKLHWLSFFGTKPQRYMVLEFFHITSR